MDTNAILVIVINGGLLLFFLYALYDMQAHIKKAGIKRKKDLETPVPEPFFEVRPSSKEESELPESIPQEAYKPESVEPTPLEHRLETPEVQLREDESPGRGRASNIIDIEGIGKVYAERLNERGIRTTDDLLEAGATRKGREELADITGIPGELILKWVNLADLNRIQGVGEEYSDLLEEVGVDTVVELALRVPENLYNRFIEVNETKNLMRRVPNLNQVQEWVRQARKIPRKIQY